MAVRMGRGLIEKQHVPCSLAHTKHCLLADVQSLQQGCFHRKISALDCWVGLAEPDEGTADPTWLKTLCIC